MLYHGAEKLRGEHLEQTAQYFEKLGIKPGKPWALATGLSELGAGLSAMLGVGTRLFALAVLVTQAVAIARVHKDKGFDITQGGFEYNLALIGIAAGLLLAGPGRISAHGAMARVAEGEGLRGLVRRARRRRLIGFLNAIR